MKRNRKKLITFGEILKEASFEDNIGFEEMMKYFQVGNDEQIKELEKHIESGDWEGFKSQIYDVLGVQLQ